MITAIDCRRINAPVIDGIGRFTLSLSKEIIKNTRSNEYFFICKDYESGEYIKSWFDKESKYSNYKIVCCPPGAVHDIWNLPRIIKKNNIDILFSPNYTTLPLKIFCKHVAVVHDLIPLIFPRYFRQAGYKFKLLLTNRLTVGLLINNFSHIIAVSNNTKEDIVKYFQTDKNKISVITEGVDFKTSGADKKKFKEKYNLPDKYILYLGRCDPYKNIDMLIRIYSRLGKWQEDYKLVLVGKEDKRYTPLLKDLARELNLSDKIIFTDFVLTDELPAIYENASLLVHPSLYEGFGLPILEAMSYGLPVVAFRTSSIPEVAGEFAVLTESYSEDQMLNAIIDLLSDEEKRKELGQKAMERSKKFTWEQTAEQVLEILKHA